MLNFNWKYPKIIQYRPYFKNGIFDISAIPAPKERHYYRKATIQKPWTGSPEGAAQINGRITSSDLCRPFRPERDKRCFHNSSSEGATLL